LKNILIRSITGIVCVVVISGSVYFHPYAFGALFTIITGLCLWEFHTFTRCREMQTLGTVSGMYLFVATFLFASGHFDIGIFLPYILLLFLILVRGLFVNKTNPLNEWLVSFFAQVYCAGFLSLLNFIAFDISHTYIPYYVLLVFVFVWINDTCAYLIGSMFGRHKMFPAISPLKSWEGFAGGFVVTLAFSLLFATLFPLFMPLYHWIAFACAVVIAATCGDMVESMMKRTFEVKDSGTILPGHGGILDRMDSVILATPVAYAYIYFFIQN